jgi:hypothetical protein
VRILFLLAMMTAIPQQNTRTLASLVDTNRVLLVFAPSDADSRFQQQLTLLHGHAAEMKDRDLVLVANLVHAGVPTGADTMRNLPAPYIFDQEQLVSRHRFHIEQGEFTIVLLGRDGGEKLRSHAPIAMQKLDETIDAMPGRQEEMKKQPPR